MTGATVVAGASRGIGAAIAEHLAGRPGAVWTVARTPASHGRWIAADLTTSAGLAAVADALAGRVIGRVIYSAGTWERLAFTRGYSFADGPLEDTQRVIDLNLVAPIKLVATLLPNLRRASSPRVVFIGALSGLDGRATREIANTASKYGLRGAAHALSLELAADDIAFTVINPGNVDTAEVRDDIARGRMPAQEPIPMADLLAVLDCVLDLSAASRIGEVHLEQRFRRSG